MSPTKRWMDSSRSSGHRMGSLSVFLLLLFVKTFLGFSYSCPREIAKGRAYSLLYFILPVVLLFILGLLLRPRRSPGLFSARCCSFGYFFYVTVQAGKAPLIWILLSMIDDRYLLCLAKHINSRWEYDYLMESFHAIVQIAGLVGLVVLLILDYCIPQSTWALNCFSCYFQKRNEDLMLEEVEVVLHQKAKEKRKAFVEDLIRSDLDHLSPEELFKKGTVPELVWKYKEMVQKKCAEGSQEINDANNFI
ncbi:calcium homeostasis modulator protein 4-like [Lithobates pipiens]